MSLKKVVNVIHKDQTYHITLDDIHSFQSLKSMISEGFNIDRKEYNLKIHLSDSNFKDNYEDEEFLIWKNNSNVDSKITIEVFKYEELLNNIDIGKSIKLEQLQLLKSHDLESSFSIYSVSSSNNLQNNNLNMEIEKPLKDPRENNDLSIIEPNKCSPETNFHFVLKEEIDEIMDQINAKLEIKSQLCEICRIPPIGARFYCIFCEDLLLCEKCEKCHLHPLIKYNNSLVKNKIQMSNLISKVNEAEALPSLSANIKNSFFIQKINSVFLNKQTSVAEINLPSLPILLPPNTEKVIQVRLSNLSIDNYISKSIVLIPLNSKDLEIEVSPLDNDIPPQKYFDIDVKIKSRDKINEYDIKFSLYNGSKEISCICKNNLKLKVGFDELVTYDDFFIDYKNILVLPSSQKKTIYELIINEVSNKTPTEICDILIKNNWNVEQSLDELLCESTN